MKTLPSIIFILLFINTKSFSQTENKKSAEASDLFDNNNFAGALPRYLDLLKSNSSNANLNYKIGFCYLNSWSQKAKAVPYFKKAFASNISYYIKSYSKETAAPFNDYQLSGDTFFLDEKFNQAISDEKYFEKELNTNQQFAGQEKIFKNANINDTIEYEVNIGTSVDGQIVLLYKNENGDGNLWTSSLNDNEWTLPEKLDKKINTKGWESNECISADGNTLYFTSNREGGFGGKDIYKSKKMKDGEWGKATNLGAVINSPYDDEAPFIYPGGAILCFSSDRNKNDIGRFEIFMSYLSGGNWTEPKNAGYPVIKSRNENISPSRNSGTDKNKTRHSSAKKIIANEKQNFLVTFIHQKEISITLLKGRVAAPNGNVPKQLKIIVADNETGDTTGIYHPSNNTGIFSIILPPRKNINITYEAEGYLFCSENINISKGKNYYEINKAVELPSLEAGEKAMLKNIFFVKDSAAILPSSEVELNNLFNFLSSDSNITVKISCFNYISENVPYNKTLPGERAQAIVNYLVEKGINKDRLIAKGYNESKPATLSKMSDESIEFKILKIK